MPAFSEPSALSVDTARRLDELASKAVSPPPEGRLDRTLSEWLGSSWRTTVSGALTLGCGVVIALDQFVPHPALHVAAQVCTALGFVTGGVVGFAAKDKRVSGVQK